MLTVALTGGIGSGKSTLARHLEQLGAGVIDTDQLAREVVLPGSPALAEILTHFGSQILTPAGELNRPLLREQVFANPAARVRLESILHPRIRALMLERLSALSAPYAVLVIPLLIETHQMALADRVLVVDLPEAEQIRRVQGRDGLDEAAVRRVLAAQVNRATRLQAADDVIDNSGAPEALWVQAQRLHQRYLDLAGTGGDPPGGPGGLAATAAHPW